MSFHPNDLEEIQHATGLDEMAILANEELERRYTRWQRRYHLMGGQGALPGAELRCLLDSLDFEPPTAKAPEVQVNWRAVPFASPVMVIKPHGAFGGKFAGVIDGASVAVVFGDDPEQHEFLPQEVLVHNGPFPVGTKTVWEDEPAATKTPEEKLAFAQEVAAKFSELHRQKGEDEREPSDVPENIGEVDRGDPSFRERGPQVRTEILGLAAGDPVLVEIDNDYKDAQFLREGPRDREVTVFVEGKEIVVSDELVTSVAVSE